MDGAVHTVIRLPLAHGRERRHNPWGCAVTMNVYEGSRSPEVVVMTPAHFDEAIHAVRAVQHRRTVVLHLGSMQTHEAQRTIDFVSGGVCAVDGQAERLADSVFLFAPTSVAIHRDPAGPNAGDAPAAPPV
jgi:cell division inhibitor SepF